MQKYQTLYDQNIEYSVISSIIYDSRILDKYIHKIKSKLFFNPINREVIEIILALYKKGKSIDEDIIRHKIGFQNENYLLEIMMRTPLSNIDSYIEILEEYLIKRELQNITENIQSDIQSKNSAIEIQAKLNNLTEQLTSSNCMELLEINSMIDVENKESEFICKNWIPIPKRTVSLISAPGGMGKSWFILQFAIKAILEGGVDKAFLWLSEDPKELSKNRFDQIFNELLNLKDETIKKKIDISDSPTIQFLYEDYRKIEVSPLFHTFKAMLQKYDLIILDPLIAFYGVDENSNANAKRFMQLFTNWANKENKTIIFIHHSIKNKTQSRGASAFVDAVRSVYEIDYVKNKNGDIIDREKRVVKLNKDNYNIYNFTKTRVLTMQLFPKSVKRQLNIDDIVHCDNGIIPQDF